MSIDITSQSTVPARSPALAYVLWALKAVALWLTIVVSFVIANKFIPVSLQPPKQDGPLSIQNAFLLVNGMIAVVLAWLASRARVRGPHLALLIFVALYAIQSGMMMLEAFYFNDSIHLPINQIFLMDAQAAVVAAVVGAVAALLFHPAAEPVSAVPSGMMARIAAMAVIYVVLYYTAGYFIAWQSSVVRAYYENGAHIAFAPVVALQILRGTLWALIALFIVTRLKGSLTSRAVLMAILFAVLTAAQLLYPNQFVPWAVRSVHLVEVGTSEAVYGVIATIVLLAGAARRPLAATSAWRLIAGRA